MIYKMAEPYFFDVSENIRFPRLLFMFILFVVKTINIERSLGQSVNSSCFHGNRLKKGLGVNVNRRLKQF